MNFVHGNEGENIFLFKELKPLLIKEIVFRKKTNLWHGTVAGTLSSGCPHHFLSGAKELGETGWWRLAEMKPPHLKQSTIQMIVNFVMENKISANFCCP